MEDITKNNNLIAEFMGWNIDKETENHLVPIYSVPNGDHKEWADTKHINEIGYYLLSENQLDFHLDWSWLMEVVEKIESLKSHSVYIKTNGCTIQDENEKVFCVWLCREVGIKSKIKAVYNACIEFINWHNSQSSCVKE